MTLTLPNSDQAKKKKKMMQRASSALCSSNPLPSLPNTIPTRHLIGAPFYNRTTRPAYHVQLPFKHHQNFRLAIPAPHSTGNFYFFFFFFLICLFSLGYYGLLYSGFVLLFYLFVCLSWNNSLLCLWIGCVLKFCWTFTAVFRILYFLISTT